MCCGSKTGQGVHSTLVRKSTMSLSVKEPLAAMLPACKEEKVLEKWTCHTLPEGLVVPPLLACWAARSDGMHHHP